MIIIFIIIVPEEDTINLIIRSNVFPKRNSQSEIIKA
jgi:hypothetical protein